MIITDFNEMTLEELERMNKKIGLYYFIENGKITKALMGE